MWLVNGDTLTLIMKVKGVDGASDLVVNLVGPTHKLEDRQATPVMTTASVADGLLEPTFRRPNGWTVGQYLVGVYGAAGASEPGEFRQFGVAYFDIDESGGGQSRYGSPLDDDPGHR